MSDLQQQTKESIKLEEPLIATRWAFTNPKSWQAAKELVKRGHYVIDRKRHLFWEWIAINDTK
jgi:hypothetical protein